MVLRVADVSLISVFTMKIKRVVHGGAAREAGQWRKPGQENRGGAPPKREAS